MTEIILLAGAVFSVISGIFFMQWGIREFGSCSGKARAQVVGIYESSSQDEGFAPVVEFSVGGETIRSRAMTEKTGSRKRVPYAEGDWLEVRYNPEKPRQFIIPGYDMNIKFILGISGLVSALILGIAAVVISGSSK